MATNATGTRMVTETPSSFATLDTYLTAFAPEMAKRVEVGMRPLFNPETEGLSAIVRRCAGGAMTPYPAQAAVIEAGIRQLARDDSLWIVGEMGTGKTPIGAWLIRAWEARIGRHTRNVVTAPNHLVYKWRDHLEALIPGCRCIIVKGYKDLLHLRWDGAAYITKEITHANGAVSQQRAARWRPPSQTEIYILPRDKGKLGYSWRCAARSRKRLTVVETNMGRRTFPHTQYVCPTCGEPVKDPDGEEVDYEYFVTPADKLRKRRTCQCGAPLWQAHNGEPGECDDFPTPGIAPRRMAPCQFLRKIGAKFDLYLADECFPGDTRIATLHGQKMIRDIRVGDLVWSSGDGKAVPKRVTRVIIKPRSQSLVRIRHEHGTVVCTPNHKIWTSVGWCRASEISVGDRLRCLQQGVLPENGHQPLLLEVVRNETPVADGHPARRPHTRSVQTTRSDGAPSGLAPAQGPEATDDEEMLHLRQPFCPQEEISPDMLQQLRVDNEVARPRVPLEGVRLDVSGSNQQVSEATGCCFGPHEETQSGPSNQGKDVGHDAGAYLFRNAGRKRYTDATANKASVDSGMAVRVSNSDGELFLEIRGHGLGASSVEGCGGNRRGLSPRQETEKPRPSEDHHGRRVGVDHPAILESGGRAGCGIGRPEMQGSRIVEIGEDNSEATLVYDLEVEDTHNYFANGILVSNCHENKGRGSLQGQLYADLTRVSRKTIALTGTLVGGYADNLLFLLWRTCAHRLVADDQKFGGEGFDAFVRLYGVMQERRRYVTDNDWQTTQDLTLGRGKQTSCYKKALPGISPVLFVNFLLDQAVFIRLAEMHSHLPPFRERVHRVPLDNDVDQALSQMQKAFEEHRDRHRPCRAWGGARAAFLRYPDKPWVDEYEVMDTNDDGVKFPAFTVPSLPRRETPKMLRVRRLVKRNTIRHRKTWIYTELTGEDGYPAWDWMNDIAEYLRSHGFRCAVLRTQGDGGPKPEDREAWIAKTAPLVDVVISHPTLVQTGLDLFDFPSLIFAFTGDNTYRLRQASRRAWRLGQSRPCEVDYVVASGKESKSLQDAALALMAKKMAASLAIEGDFSSDGLAAMAGEEDMASQLARFIAGELTDLDSKDAFAQYRQKFDLLMPDLGIEIKNGIEPGHETPPPPVLEDPMVIAPAPIQPPTIPEGMSETATPPRKPKPRKPKPRKPRMPKHNPSPTGQEPSGISERKVQRKEALVKAMRGNAYWQGLCTCSAGTTLEIDEDNGDLVKIGSQWFHVVAKHRRTVRARNFARDMQDTIIAFVEPVNEVGPTDSNLKVDVNGVIYIVSFMLVSAYLTGERKPDSDIVNWQGSQR